MFGHTIIRKIKLIMTHYDKKANTKIVSVDISALYDDSYDNEVSMYKWYDDWYTSGMNNIVYNKGKANELHTKGLWIINTKSLYITHMEIPDVSANKHTIRKIQQNIYWTTKYFSNPPTIEYMII